MYNVSLPQPLYIKREERMRIVRSLFQQGFSVGKIHRDTGIPETTLRRWLKPLIKKRRQERQELKEKAMELKRQGLNQEEAAKELGGMSSDNIELVEKE